MADSQFECEHEAHEHSMKLTLWLRFQPTDDIIKLEGMSVSTAHMRSITQSLAASAETGKTQIIHLTGMRNGELSELIVRSDHVVLVETTPETK